MADEPPYHLAPSSPPHTPHRSHLLYHPDRMLLPRGRGLRQPPSQQVHLLTLRISHWGDHRWRTACRTLLDRAVRPNEAGVAGRALQVGLGPALGGMESVWIRSVDHLGGG